MLAGITYCSDGIMEYKNTPPLNASGIRNDIDVVVQLNGKLDDNYLCKYDATTQLVKQSKDVYRNTEHLCLNRIDSGTLTIEWLESRIDECLNKSEREKLAGVAVFVYQTYLTWLKQRTI